MNEMIRELEENIKRERYDRIWNGVGKAMVWLSVGVIVATIAIVVWNQQAEKKSMMQTNLLIRGIDRLVARDFKGAIPIFKDIAQDKESDLYPIALLRLAQAHMGLGDTDATVRTYKELAKTGDAFAGLAHIMLPPANGNVPKPRVGSAFYYSVSEVRGWRLFGLEQQRDSGIAQLLALYEDEKTPMSMRLRVTEALQEIAPKRLQKVANYILEQERNAQQGDE